nr:TadE/TadG family type IV pilus assembly protein [uncultured Celeribacter sp.]
MIRTLVRFSRRCRTPARYVRDQRGTTTIEFALFFPLFTMIMLGGYEIGYYTVTHSMLERGLDLAVRDVRLGRMTEVTLPNLKSTVCTYARYVRHCEDNIHIALEPINAREFTPPQTAAACIDRAEDVTPATTFTDGGENELMLVRACVNVDPVFPTTWIGAALERYPGSGYAMAAIAGFVNEPNT